MTAPKKGKWQIWQTPLKRGRRTPDLIKPYLENERQARGKLGSYRTSNQERTERTGIFRDYKKMSYPSRCPSFLWANKKLLGERWRPRSL